MKTTSFLTNDTDVGEAQLEAWTYVIGKYARSWPAKADTQQHLRVQKTDFSHVDCPPTLCKQNRLIQTHEMLKSCTSFSTQSWMQDP